MRAWTSALLLLFLLSCARAEKQPLEVSVLRAPAGFHLTILAQVKSPRLMTFSPGGALLATSTGEGQVYAIPDPKPTGRAERVVTALQELNAPHGIAFHNGKLYVAETNAVRRYDWDEASLRASNPQLVTQLPGGGGHYTRSLLFANGKLYVSVGSSCNVCGEKDKRRAAVLEFNQDGSGERIFASGLRNAVGLALNSKTGTVWTTENGRDWLGDDVPPDEINDLGANGGNFGWPNCYSHLPTDALCRGTVPPRVKLQAHSAPLGSAFYTGSMFPPEYRGDLFVALHGSWNRSIPTGYKVIRIKLSDKSEPQGVEDFITGWIRPGETRKGVWMGRPVGMVVGPDGALYISDDAAGAIYRVTYKQ